MSGSLIARRTITCIRTPWSEIKTLFSAKEFVNNSNTFGGVRHFSVSKSRNMKFVQFVYNGKPEEVRVGYVEGDNVVDINKADSSLPTTLLSILRNGDIEKVKKLKSTNPPTVPLSTVTLKAPIHGIDKVLCVGLNYKDHCAEQNLTPPEVPMIFSKFASCIIGPNDAVRLRTEVTQAVDYEIEMTAVIGKKASRVKADDAYDYVFGYTIGQDICDRQWQNMNGGQILLGKKVDWEVELVVVIGKEASFVKAADAYKYVLGCTVAQDISARDWQKAKNGGQFLLGKAMDTFCPIGPYIVTSDELGDPETLDIKCSVNGVQKQSSNTNQLVHKIPAVIERLTTVMTLLPGDIILTGTPGGVGMYRSPPEYLQPGDTVVSEIKGIGALTTRVEKF